MREIARASSISQPLVHYHFGSQEGLYRAVRERLLKEGLGSVLSFSEGSPDANDHPSELLRATYDFVSDREDLMRLVAWSHLERKTLPGPVKKRLPA